MNFNERIKLWYDAIRHPVLTFKKQKPRANIEEGVINVVSSAILSKLLSLVTTAVFLVFSANALSGDVPEGFWTSFMEGSGGMFSGDFVVSPVLLVFNILIGLALLLAGWAGGGWIIHKVAGWLGGKGEFKTQLYLTSLFMPAFSVIAWFVNFVAVLGITAGIITRSIPTLMASIIVFLALMILAAIYEIYCFIRALVETYKFSGWLGLAVCIIGTLIIVAIIIGLLLLVAGASIGAFSLLRMGL